MPDTSEAPLETKSYQHAPDRPWIFRTYAGHSTAKASNALYRQNLAKGQTGLSIAFDLPTQTALDSDHILSRGEVGKVGVPISHLGDMRALFDGIPLDQMNTSMTINAPAAWLIALYVALADEQGASRAGLRGTTQNDIVKEYLSRGTYVFAPEPSMKLTSDTISWCYREVPKWNPLNVCSYHLQEAGATPEQELAFALATAIAVLDAVKAGGEVPDEKFDIVFGRISFFVNAGMRFVTEIAKMRAFTEMWEEIGKDRYGVTNSKSLLFRYGVQVNSLGLTEQQAENNVYRILLEALAVTLSKKARCRALQLPAWNEALGLPTPFDQQWSLRIQQILAFETDLLEFEDIFDGSYVIADKVSRLKQEAYTEIEAIAKFGGTLDAEGQALQYMKAALVVSQEERLKAIETGEQTVVGVNKYETSEESPFSAGTLPIQKVDPKIEFEQIAALNAWRAARDEILVQSALSQLQSDAEEGRNIMPASVEAAKVGVTTGEWGHVLREVFGEYRGPTGVAIVIGENGEDEALGELENRVDAASAKLGRRLTYVMGKPGLDGHSNGAEQLATRARKAGMNVVYEGIRFTPEEIVAQAKKVRAHVIGLSILSGSHIDLVQETTRLMANQGLGDIPLVVGGIIPDEDIPVLRQMGVKRVYTPKDYQLNEIIGDVVTVVEETLA